MKTALVDFLRGASMVHVWLYFGLSDTKIKYRRSVLGPLWYTIGTGIMVGGMGLLWSTLWKLPAAEFLPYIAAGLITWMFLVSVVSEGCQTFIVQASVVKNIPISLWIHPLRQSTRALLLYLHNLLVYVAIAVLLDVPVTAWTALFPLAAFVLFWNAVWISTAFGTLSARLRDIPPLVEYVMPMFLFLTPILWKPEALGPRAYFADFNPFTHYIEIVRAPLMGVAPRGASWAIVLTISIVGSILALALLARARRRLPFWL